MTVVVKVNLDQVPARKLAPLVSAIAKVLPNTRVDVDADGWMTFVEVSTLTSESSTS